RFADLAIKHIKNNPVDRDRLKVIESRARESGFASAADFIHDVQGRPDTRSFQANKGRVCWFNEAEKLYGWNNHAEPQKSTVIRARKAGIEFDNHKNAQARSQGIDFGVPELGPLTEKNRQVDPALLRPAATLSDRAKDLLAQFKSYGKTLCTAAGAVAGA